MRPSARIGWSAAFAMVVALLLLSTTVSAGPPGAVGGGAASQWRFSVEREGVSLGIFSLCGMMGSKNEVATYLPGGGSPPIKIPGAAEYFDVECSRPIGPSLALWDWRQQVLDQNKGFKSTVSIFLLNQAADVAAAWQLDNAWPSAVTTTVGIDGATITETVVLTCERISRVQ